MFGGAASASEESGSQVGVFGELTLVEVAQSTTSLRRLMGRFDHTVVAVGFMVGDGLRPSGQARGCLWGVAPAVPYLLLDGVM